MKVLVVLFVAMIVAAQAVSIYDLVAEEWNTFKTQHKKTYKSEVEEKFRMKIFIENKYKIARHNDMYEKEQISYEIGLNKYSDMLHHEFIHKMNGFKQNKFLGGTKDNNDSMGVHFVAPAHVVLPESVDWRKEGAVTEVKDQGQCGSCWAFSATGSLEGQHFRKTGEMVSLSEQNLMDCSGNYGNDGCEGGLMDNAFRYVKDNHGIDTEESYPYEAEDATCRYNPKNNGADDVGFVDIASGDEEKLKAAVATIGPVSVAMDASQESFQQYKSGIYYEPNCSSTDLDHGVLVVGYGIDEHGKDYWLVKNSWGEGWGEKGYFKMPRNQNNHCGIATFASYPLV